ncbi:MAG: Helix-turn-helix protein [Subtercola sp.]|nr:Helix-turn-helix protein [Subtercola sp.]
MTKTFRRGDERIASLLAKPGVADRVAEIEARARAEDRIYASGLAMIREAGKLTQTELARRMDVTQGSVSRLESRGDALLSTLQGYLEAAGARHPRLLVTVDGAEIELELADLTRRSSSSAQNSPGGRIDRR